MPVGWQRGTSERSVCLGSQTFQELFCFLHGSLLCSVSGRDADTEEVSSELLVSITQLVSCDLKRIHVVIKKY